MIVAVRGIIRMVVVLSLVGGCRVSCNAHPDAKPAPAEASARAIADVVATNLVREGRHEVYGVMHSLLRQQMDEAAFGKMLDAIYAMMGQPKEATFKLREDAIRVLPSERLRSHKYWYSMPTTKTDKGPTFLFVDMVQENNSPVVAEFKLMYFPEGVPPMLR